MTKGQEGLFIKSGPASDRLSRDEKVEGNELVSPALFFSEAQSNVLSISLFLTKIAATREKPFDFLIMDDPIQSMDDINAYAFIDMCRIFTAKFNKQIIITTHDIGFFNLFKKRFPPTAFNFKYFSIDSSIKVYQ
jgi:wobble nucleotide-excising tRNase